MAFQVRRRVVIVGIPGVGKTTVVNKTIEKMSTRNIESKVVNYGTMMMEHAASDYGVKSRDDMRKLPVESQKKLQVRAANAIAKLEAPVVLIDTHLFISTREGFWPGMPIDVLQALQPTHLVLVVAAAQEILERRAKDSTRMRDKATLASIALELEAAKSLLFCSTLVSGCPGLIISNESELVDKTADAILEAIL